MRIILFIFSLLISFAAFSQEFVVKETGDTLFGEVKVKEGGGYKYKISVKPIGQPNFLELEENEVKAYQIGEKGFLQSKEKAIYSFFVKKEIIGDGVPYIMFLEPLIRNQSMNLFEEVKTGYTPNGTSFVGGTSYSYSVYYSEKGGGTLRINKFEFKKTVSNLVSDCPNLAKKIGNKGYKYNDMYNIVEEYNTTCGKK